MKISPFKRNGLIKNTIGKNASDSIENNSFFINIIKFFSSSPHWVSFCIFEIPNFVYLRRRIKKMSCTLRKLLDGGKLNAPLIRLQRYNVKITSA